MPDPFWTFMAEAFIGLGSNLGDRAGHLAAAVETLRCLPGTRLTGISRWVETDPVGGPPQGRFLNGVVELETRLPPERLLEALQRIETDLGRPREHTRWGPRTIDLDLIAYNRQVRRTPELTLPHPRLHERRFVLEPLVELRPNWRHPVLKKTATELLEAL